MLRLKQDAKATENLKTLNRLFSGKETVFTVFSFQQKTMRINEKEEFIILYIYI